MKIDNHFTTKKRKEKKNSETLKDRTIGDIVLDLKTTIESIDKCFSNLKNNSDINILTRDILNNSDTKRI